MLLKETALELSSIEFDIGTRFWFMQCEDPWVFLVNAPDSHYVKRVCTVGRNFCGKME